MKNFLTKEEACEVLSKIKSEKDISKNNAMLLESIRICLVGDMQGASLWGKQIEEISPLFRECASSYDSASKDNYEAYKEAFNKAQNIAREE